MIIAVLALLGLCLGSFVNALVFRVHAQSKLKSGSKKKIGKRDVDLSVSRGRSVCIHCGHELAAKDLIPLLSWLLLRGKCRYCHRPISWQYPLVELTASLLFIMSYIFWPVELSGQGLAEWLEFGVWLFILTGFIALVIYDFKWMLLPNRIILPLTVLALIPVVISVATEGVQAFFAVLYSVLIAGGLFLLLFQISSGKWIGGGDVKLGGLIGLVLANPVLAFLMLLSASLLGTIAVIPALASKKLKSTSRIPFGPFLIVATIVVKLVGFTVFDWYKRSIGIE